MLVQSRHRQGLTAHRFQDFTSLQSRQIIDVQLNLDGIACIPGANVPPFSCSVFKIHDTYYGKALTSSHYPIVCQFHNEDNVPLAFPDKDVGGLASAAHTITMGRQLS